MKYFLTLDADRYIVGASFTDEPPHKYAVEAHAPPPINASSVKTKYIDGQYVSDEDAWVKPSYSDMRRTAYPDSGQQLDAIWHAMDQGLLPKIEPMYSNIKAVKEQFPKPAA